jgi:CRISPR-associated exonuclease Cas4
MTTADDEFQPISALNDLLFCERRCAMHRIEGVWTENAYTLEGTHGHRRAHRVMVQTAPGVRAVHGMMLRSDRLQLVGKADVVEFHAAIAPATPDGSFNPEPTATARQNMEHSVAVGSGLNKSGSGLNESEVPYPVEYKRGRRKRWDNDDVQLCAQALCLEEMLGLAAGDVAAGAIFHAKSKRRREVLFTPELRAKTEQAARRLHELMALGVTPPPVWKARCRGCSLLALCLPVTLSQTQRVAAYTSQLYRAEAEPSPPHEHAMNTD